MKEQIKDMEKDLGIAFQLAGTTRFGAVAEILVNAGYRKQSEGEWIKQVKVARAGVPLLIGRCAS